jgi:pimeloyl-ACP methyl ester carboxylesterase
MNCLIRSDLETEVRAEFAADRAARACGEAAATMPVAVANPMARAALPSADSYQYFYGRGGVIERNPAFPNQITTRSIENILGYEPGWYVPDISPTPMLMVVASDDVVTPSSAALHVFETAAQPKKLVIIPGGHFDAYRGPSSDLAKDAARRFLVEHLCETSSP